MHDDLSKNVFQATPDNIKDVPLFSCLNPLSLFVVSVVNDSEKMLTG
jgi:hypothetical protein